MADPVLDETHYSRQNVLFPDVTSNARIHQSWVFLQKEFLIGAVATGNTNGVRPAGSFWTVEGSCDGTTAGMDAVDRWTSTFDATKLVMASTGVAHSWIVLKSPSAFGPVYMVIDLNSSTPGSAGFIFSSTPFTGGSTTTRPTATKEWAANLNSTPNTSTTYAFTSEFTAASIYRAHFTCTASGEWHFATSRDTSAIFHSYMSCLKCVETHASDVAPWAVVAHQAVSSRGAPTQAAFQAAAGCAGRVWNDSTVRTTGGFNSWSFGSTSLNNMKPDILLSENICLPLWAFDHTSGFEAWRGRLPNVFAITSSTPTGAAVGASFPNQGSPVQTVMGEMLLPFGCVPQL